MQDHETTQRTTKHRGEQRRGGAEVPSDQPRLRIVHRGEDEIKLSPIAIERLARILIEIAQSQEREAS
jgi:hypothetical protein